VEIISTPTVEQGFAQMWNMKEQDAYRLSFMLEKEQPVLVAYLAAVDQEILNQSERELLFYLGTVVWQVFSNQKSPLPSISQDCLLRLEAANNAIATALRSEGKANFSELVKKVLKECRQREVLRYVIAALMDEDSTDNDVRDEVLGYIILDLKTVIECFDETAESEERRAVS
jgi:hypothetical protein